ncbi:GAF domain-containing protein [Candidatus Acetothermia bacterium]|nr:GAF domain-containing protein [Candidatus Acetothermia bacterium]
MERRQSEIAQIKREAQALVQLAASYENNVIEGARQLLISLAQFSRVRRDPSTCSALLSDLHTQEVYTSLAVAKPDGDIYCSAPPLSYAVSVADREWFQRTVQTRRFAVGEYQIDFVTRKSTIYLSYPALDTSGRIQAIAIAGLDLSSLNRLLASVPLPSGAVMLIVDRQGRVLNSYPDREKWIKQQLPGVPLVKHILQQKKDITEVAGLDGVSRLYAFTPLDSTEETSIYLAIGIPPRVAFAETNWHLVRNLALLGVGALLALAMAWFGSSVSVLRQVNALVSAAQRLSGGDLSARTGLRQGTGELGQLTRTFDQMAARLEQREIEHLRQELSEHILAEAGKVLAVSRDYQTRLSNVVQVAVPQFADWCMVHLVKEGVEGVQAQLIAVAHKDPLKEQLAYELQCRYPPDPNEPRGVYHVMSTGQPEFYSDIPDALLEAWACDAKQLENICKLGIKSAMIVPLVARGRNLGAITFVRAASSERYDTEDLALAQSLADRTALAVDNARLYEKAQQMNTQLEQRVSQRTAQLQAAIKVLENEIAERKQTEDRLISSQGQLRALAAHQHSRLEEERTHLAREIHDDLGQLLAALKMDLAWLSKKLSEQQPLQEKTKSLIQLVESTAKSMRKIVMELRPGVTEDLGLIAALEGLAQEFQMRSKIKSQFTSNVKELSLGTEYSTAIYRIVQEALTNTARHAHATEVQISLCEQADQLILTVRDNGKGINSQDMTKAKSFGLLGIRERALVFGGEVEIDGVARQGTTLTVRIPLRQEGKTI